MKKHLFYAILGVYITTAIITLGGILHLIEVDPDYLKALFAAFLLESAATIYAIARREDLLSESETPRIETPMHPKLQTKQPVADSTHPDQQPARLPKLTIISAQYGRDHAQRDVTRQVQSYVTDGVLNVLATHEQLGLPDVIYGINKILTVICRMDDRERTFKVPEGERLIIP